MKKSKEIILLLLILLIAVFFRFYKLGSIPNGLYVDEAVSGYNAYSILKTGKDEYGKFFPIAFRFFGSYSPPLYVYLTSVSVKFLDLSVFSTRFVSALSGVWGTFLIYLFLKELGFLKSRLTPLIGSFVFAILPWSIFFSRTGYELNLGFTILSSGLLFLMLGLTRPKFLIPGFLLVSISTYGAHPERFFVPIFLLSFLIIFRKILFSKNSKRYLRWGLILTFITQLPNIYFFTTPAFGTKSSLFYGFFGPYLFLREFLSQYLTYFSPRSLFFLGDPDIQRSLPELSVFYPWLILPYLVGLYLVWKNKKEIVHKFLLVLLLLSPVPIALTGDPFSSQRALHMLLSLFLVISIGIDYFLNICKKTTLVVVAFLVCISLIYLWRSYFILLPYERARVWGYGFRELAMEIKNHSKVKYMIDQGRIKPAYIELAFFLKYPPQELQRTIDPKIPRDYYQDVIFSENYKFANIEIRPIKWEKDIYIDQVLVGDELSISTSQAKEHFLTKVFEIRDPLDNAIFVGFKTHPKEKCASEIEKDPLCRD